MHELEHAVVGEETKDTLRRAHAPFAEVDADERMPRHCSRPAPAPRGRAPD